MPSRDLLVLAGLVAEDLERHGLVACGRREDGVTRVDFWSREGRTYRHVLEHDETGAEAEVEDVVAVCLAMAKLRVPPSRPTSQLN